MTEPRTCAYEKCSERFTPKRPHQRFHHRDCRYAQWDLERERGDAQSSGQRVEKQVRRQSRDGKGTKVYLQPEELVYLWGQARASSLVWINGRRLDLPGLRNKLSRAADRTAGITR